MDRRRLKGVRELLPYALDNNASEVFERWLPAFFSETNLSSFVVERKVERDCVSYVLDELQRLVQFSSEAKFEDVEKIVADVSVKVTGHEITGHEIELLRILWADEQGKNTTNDICVEIKPWIQLSQHFKQLRPRPVPDLGTSTSI